MYLCAVLGGLAAGAAPAAAAEPCTPGDDRCRFIAASGVGMTTSLGNPDSALLATIHRRLTGTSSQPEPAYPVKAAPPSAFPELVWGRIVGRVGSIDATEDTPATDMRGGGAFVGIDLPYDAATRYGIAGGFSRSSIEDTTDNKIEADGYHISAYATHAEGAWRLRGIASYAYYDLESRRSVSLGRGNFGHPEADYASSNVEALGELSYVAPLGIGTVEPYAAAGISWLYTGAYTETGDAGIQSDLTVQDSSQVWPYVTLGARFAASFEAAGMSFVPTLDLGWRHVFGDIDPTVGYDIPSRGDFAISGVPIAEDTFVLGLGLDTGFANGWRGSLKYLGEIADTADAHTFSAGLAIPF
ncbi:MAG TPA: autotransporter outer membrane beta-barrel domain-containing protein [Xanthobacteraceae bacterium]|nr:autotransporter outer membrane beta-barrel domain-containing protein [Xanthobacteraceae bacterium]